MVKIFKNHGYVLILAIQKYSLIISTFEL